MPLPAQPISPASIQALLMHLRMQKRTIGKPQEAQTYADPANPPLPQIYQDPATPQGPMSYVEPARPQQAQVYADPMSPNVALPMSPRLDPSQVKGLGKVGEFLTEVDELPQGEWYGTSEIGGGPPPPPISEEERAARPRAFDVLRPYYSDPYYENPDESTGKMWKEIKASNRRPELGADRRGPERVIGAAFKDPQTGETYGPANVHANVEIPEDVLNRLLDDPASDPDGFLTSNNRFINREEAGKAFNKGTSEDFLNQDEADAALRAEIQGKQAPPPTFMPMQTGQPDLMPGEVPFEDFLNEVLPPAGTPAPEGMEHTAEGYKRRMDTEDALNRSGMGDILGRTQPGQGADVGEPHDSRYEPDIIDTARDAADQGAPKAGDQLPLDASGHPVVPGFGSIDKDFDALLAAGTFTDDELMDYAFGKMFPKDKDFLGLPEGTIDAVRRAVERARARAEGRAEPTIEGADMGEGADVGPDFLAPEAGPNAGSTSFEESWYNGARQHEDAASELSAQFDAWMEMAKTTPEDQLRKIVEEDSIKNQGPIDDWERGRIDRLMDWFYGREK